MKIEMFIVFLLFYLKNNSSILISSRDSKKMFLSFRELERIAKEFSDCFQFNSEPLTPEYSMVFAGAAIGVAGVWLIKQRKKSEEKRKERLLTDDA